MSTYDEQLNSLSVLINGVRVAQKQGIYSLEEAEVLSRAVRSFQQPPQQDTPQPRSQVLTELTELTAEQQDSGETVESTSTPRKRGRPSKK